MFNTSLACNRKFVESDYKMRVRCNIGDIVCWECGLLGLCNVQDVECSGCWMLGMRGVRDVGCWDVGCWDVVCWGCVMFGMCSVGDMGYLGCGMFGCGMFGMWDVRDVVYWGYVACLVCGMLQNTLDNVKYPVN